MNWNCKLEWSNISKNREKGLFCDLEFEHLLNLNNIRTFINLILTLEKDNKVSEAESKFLKLKRFERKNIESRDVHYFKAYFKNKVYFLKHSLKPSILWSWWKIEAISNNEAQSILTINNIDWAEVIKFKFWYTNEKNKYYMSDWYENENSTPLDLYLEEIDNELKSDNKTIEDIKILEDIYSELNKKIEILKELFNGFFDFHEHNIFIDTKTRKMFLFDLTKW